MEEVIILGEEVAVEVIVMEDPAHIVAVPEVVHQTVATAMDLHLREEEVVTITVTTVILIPVEVHDQLIGILTEMTPIKEIMDTVDQEIVHQIGKELEMIR